MERVKERVWLTLSPVLPVREPRADCPWAMAESRYDFAVEELLSDMLAMFRRDRVFGISKLMMGSGLSNVYCELYRKCSLEPGGAVYLQCPCSYDVLVLMTQARDCIGYGGRTSGTKRDPDLITTAHY